jgi:hypothetical protein
MSSIVIAGDTSGTVTLDAPAVAGSTVLTLPATSGAVLTTTSPKAGNVIQVVSATTLSQTSTTGTSYVQSTLTASITPTSSSSEILILVMPYTRTTPAGGSTSLTVYRNDSSIEASSAGMNYTYAASTTLEITGNIVWIDSPATTSSTTYTVYFKHGDAAGTSYVGASIVQSQITLLEIAG